MVTKFRVQSTSNNRTLFFTCGTYATAQLMAAGCAVPTRIVAVQVGEDSQAVCLECGSDLDHAADYKARRCSECAYYKLDSDEEDE